MASPTAPMLGTFVDIPLLRIGLDMSIEQFDAQLVIEQVFDVTEHADRDEELLGFERLRLPRVDFERDARRRLRHLARLQLVRICIPRRLQALRPGRRSESSSSPGRMRSSSSITRDLGADRVVEVAELQPDRAQPPMMTIDLGWVGRRHRLLVRGDLACTSNSAPGNGRGRTPVADHDLDSAVHGLAADLHAVFLAATFADAELVRQPCTLLEQPLDPFIQGPGDAAAPADHLSEVPRGRRRCSQ